MALQDLTMMLPCLGCPLSLKKPPIWEIPAQCQIGRKDAWQGVGHRGRTPSQIVFEILYPSPEAKDAHRSMTFN